MVKIKLKVDNYQPLYVVEFMKMDREDTKGK